MARRADPPAQGREPLSRERVLRTAMDIADREGIDALSMRRLAAELGVEAMSLYYHVKSKDDLLAGIVDLALQEIEPASGAGQWKSAIRRSAMSYHEALERHPWVNNVTSGGASSAVFDYMDGLLKRLREAGLSPEVTHHAYHALESHVVGSALWLARIPPKEELDALATEVLQQLPADRYPDVVHHIRQHLGNEVAGMRFFEFGLDLLLDGIERLREASRTEGPRAQPRTRKDGSRGA